MTTQTTFRERILTIVKERRAYRDPGFSAQRMAEELGVSVFKVSRVLKKEFGMSFSDLMHSYRIADAMAYLKNARYNPYTVDDIGAMTGFNNRQSFFNAFKKIAGTTPEQFRKAAGSART